MGTPPPNPEGAASTPQSPGPLSERHLGDLAEAGRGARRFRRAAGVAKASAWTTGSFGVISVLGGLFGDAAAIALGAVMVAVGVREGLLARRMGSLEPGTPRKLAANQLFLGGTIVAYALWEIISSRFGGASESSGDASVDAMLAEYAGLARSLSMGFYLLLAVGGAAGTGLMAAYYHRRQRPLAAFLAATPPWIVRVIRTQA